MKKILIAVNASKVNMHVLDFACFLANLTHSTLKAIFLEKVYGEPVPGVKWALGTPYLETVLETDIPENKVLQALYKQNIEMFEQACDRRGVNFSIHFEKDISTDEIIAESRFADLIVADPELSFNERPENIPSAFTKVLLSKSECPVVIAPYKFEEIDEIVFGYNGSASSVFAIKQFTSLFPQLADTKLTVVQIDDSDESAINQRNKIGELLQNNYSSIGFQQLQGDPADAMFEFLLGKKNIFVVMGAYGRNMLSGFFRRSTADLVVKTLNLPLFIAHH
jgi:hypothetical protein